MGDEITVHDIECKLQEKMEQYELEGNLIRLDELSKLMGWILCDDDY